jgi:hypothetical protein
METLGTLTLSLVVTVPGYDTYRSRTKHVTLARYHRLTVDAAREIKARFIKTNDDLIPDFINAKWEHKQYL